MWRTMLEIGVVLLWVTGPALAEDRQVELANGSHAVVDDGAGRVDFYASDGRRTGWGRLDGTGQRTEFFSPEGTPTGYAERNPVSGRLEFYDAGGRQLGWGEVTPDGRVRQFGLNGQQLPDTAVPLSGRTK
jgi:hypothetical protein